MVVATPPTPDTTSSQPVTSSMPPTATTTTEQAQSVPEPTLATPSTVPVTTIQDTTSTGTDTPLPQPPTIPEIPPTTETKSAEPAKSTIDTDLKTSTTKEEKASVSAQIEDFANNSTTAQSSEPKNQDSTSKDDAVLTSALNDLTTNATPRSTSNETASPNMAVPPSPSADQPVSAATLTPKEPEVSGDVSDNSNIVTIANKKIIQPIKTEPKPGLDELLAAEESKNPKPAEDPPMNFVDSTNPSDNPSQAVVSSPFTNSNNPSPGSTFQPNNAPVVPPNPAAPTDSDPNNIAL